MKRFMGLMPSSEIEKSERFVDNFGKNIIVDAGENGWTIIYADGSTEYKDVEDSVENNFNTAVTRLKTILDVKEIHNKSIGEDEGLIDDNNSIFNKYLDEVYDTLCPMAEDNKIENVITEYILDIARKNKIEKLEEITIRLVGGNILCVDACDVKEYYYKQSLQYKFV